MNRIEKDAIGTGIKQKNKVNSKFLERLLFMVI